MHKTSLKYILALIAGGILPLAFAPYGCYPLAIIAPITLFLLWRHQSPITAAWLGFLFGIGFFGCGVSWVYISIHVYGYTSILLAGFITALFIAYLALFPALQGWICAYFFPKNNALKYLLVYPTTWVLCEYLRSWLFTGFPWLLLGYSQIDSPLGNLAPIIGVYGISFMVTLIAGALLYLWQIKNNPIRIAVICGLMLLWAGSIALDRVQWVKPDHKKIQVTLIQGNVPQEIKWQESDLFSILNLYLKLAKQHLDSSIIIWPEAAIPTAQNAVQNFINSLSALAAKNHATIITGIPIAQNHNIYNGAIALGANHGVYLKRHLVPFGEYLPLKNIFGNLIKFFDIPMSDLKSGDRSQTPFIIGDIRIAPFICYEIIYPQLVLDYLPQAQLLLTISDDSWFGKSNALAQHLEMARMRSLEVGRYQLMVTNTGITAIIDAHGKIVAQAPSFQPTTLTATIQLTDGTTPYVKIQNTKFLTH